MCKNIVLILLFLIFAANAWYYYHVYIYNDVDEMVKKGWSRNDAKSEIDSAELNTIASIVIAAIILITVIFF